MRQQDRTPKSGRAIIVAHGSPSDPDPLDRILKELAANVADLLPGLEISGATLAKPGSVEAALTGAGERDQIMVYPFFMSAGWFVKMELKRRVEAATSAQTTFLTPFGLDNRIPELCTEIARDALNAKAVAPQEAVLVLAAHGSRKGHAAARAAWAVAKRIEPRQVFREVRVGFVEQDPTIAEAASHLGGCPAVCLPLFATTASHVQDDIPDQLAQAHFRGETLPPVGEAAAVATLIADVLRSASAAMDSTQPALPHR